MTRICRLLAVTAAGLLAALGLLTHPPGMLAGVVIAIVFVGPLTATCAHNSDPSRGAAVRLGAVAAAATVAVSAAVAGLVTLLGPTAAVAIVLLIGGAGAWTWRRGPSWRHQAIAWARWRRGPGATRRPAPRPAAPSTTAPVRSPAAAASPASTADLCAAWRQTYRLLHDLPLTSPDRVAVIDTRRWLLDELERRDPDGFGRWMATEPRAGSDPRRYLTVDHRPPLTGGPS